MSDLSANRLPATFRSLYRLFLRVASTSVLHHPRASRNLRRRWRPTFDDAARVTRDLQNKAGSEADMQARVDWLEAWNKRMDNTLEFLYTSSHSRGLPSKVTRALAFAVHDERARALSKLFARKTWKPSNPEFASQHLKSLEKQKKQDVIDRNSLLGMEEVLKMAEATSGLVLGTNTLPLGRYVHRPRRK